MIWDLISKRKICLNGFLFLFSCASAWQTVGFLFQGHGRRAEGAQNMELNGRSRREERELLGLLRAVGGRREQEMLVTGDFSLVQN